MYLYQEPDYTWPRHVENTLVKYSLASIVFLALVVAATPARGMPGTSVSGWHATPYASVAWFMIGFELGPWEDYLVHELTPDLERLTVRELPRVTWLQFDERLIIPDFAHSLIETGPSKLALSLTHSRSAMLFADTLGSRGNLGEGYRFEQSLVMPGITHSVSDKSALTVSAILASQRYGASGMDLRESDALIGQFGSAQSYELARSEVSHGAGVRFALNTEPFDGIRLEAAFQSRIDMSEFASMRGVHGAHAELDIPPRVQLGVQLNATPRSSLNLGVSQIFYSEIGAFPSRALPARFNALLGDRNSPQFAWDDLVVYNLGWQWRHDNDLELYVDYRTRSQPRPTAPSLATALNSELAQNSVLLGFSKGVGNSRVHFNAAYAPPEFAFGGNVLGVVSDKLDQSLEVQALWSLEF